MPPDGMLPLLSKVGASSPESVMFMVVVTLVFVLVIVIVWKDK